MVTLYLLLITSSIYTSGKKLGSLIVFTLYLLLITLSVVGILGLAGAAAPSAGVALVVGLVDMM